jgi:hypothetical protein
MMPTNPIEFHTDPEHAGIRAVIFPLIIVCVIAANYLINTLARVIWGINDVAIVLSCVLALFAGLGLASLGEMGLKRVWKSGEKVVVDNAGISLIRKNETGFTLRNSAPIYTLKWYFNLKGYPRAGRERRIQEKWDCFACQLMQDDERLIVYTFLSPKQGIELKDKKKFHAIDPKEVYDTSMRGRVTRVANRPQISSRILSGKDGRYWSAEQKRWQDGVELQNDDFLTLMNIVEQNETITQR